MMHIAVSLAESNERYPKWRLGAAIVKGGSVLAKGISSLRNNPKFIPDGENCSEHAEIAALRKAKNSNIRGATIYVARIGRDGDMKLAKPCDSCMDALSEAGIRKVVYTTAYGNKEERITNVA